MSNSSEKNVGRSESESSEDWTSRAGSYNHEEKFRASQDLQMPHEEIEKPLPFCEVRRRLCGDTKRNVLTAPAAAEASPAAAAGAGFARLKAVLAVHGTVATRLERDRGLLPATGTDDRRTPRFAALIAAAATAPLFVLLCLATRLAALRRRIATFAEEILILSGKREGLPAIAAHKLLIFSHNSLSSINPVCAALDVLPRSLTTAAS
ncbi:MAG: hypothetical protein WAL75_22140 [Terracidiphilus sp.]